MVNWPDLIHFIQISHLKNKLELSFKILEIALDGFEINNISPRVVTNQ